ncbi:hypothetical protein CDL12_23072 [Handroanthus impetiginosus]|uniref:Uncharacterized protein n=1 Tax=Handroanthus impetiginosus TaxID=429701 RepID=A0A2G9GGH7_9LAMI|nr:hypothetical protein CDL12_23072 [Handroanthus impetiginosus]
MASLLLLFSELLRHENLDNLMSLPPPNSAATAPPSPAAKKAASKTERSLPTNCKNDQFQEELPRVCVDLVWP